MKTDDALSTFKKMGLTRREADVLLWIARGQSNAEIGAILRISPRTVKKHLEHVFRKLAVKTRLAAAVRAGQACSARSRTAARKTLTRRTQTSVRRRRSLRFGKESRG